MNSLFTHRTKEGQLMLILKMEDRHLINTARMLTKQAANLRDVQTLDINEIDEAMLFRGRKHITDPQQIAKMIQEKIERALPFLLEMFVRGLQDPEIRTNLNVALNRGQVAQLKAAGDVMLPPLSPLENIIADSAPKTRSVHVHGSDNTDFFADDPLGDL